jgi:Asp-tRNA(Asn)/Glu-tRNA(Gln) amidotransferase A subunit family amidase
VLDTLRSLGLELKSVDLPEDDLNYFLEDADRAAGLEQFTRSDRDALLSPLHQRRFNRSARLIPAVEYLQANRIRMLLMEQVAKVMADLDVIVAPYQSINPLFSSTGHPAVAVPSGFDAKGMPTGIAFVGQIYKEAELLAVAKTYQAASGFMGKHPNL